MADTPMHELKQQLDAQNKMISEIRDALLGSIDGRTGLLEQHRLNTTHIQSMQTELAANKKDIAELQLFMSEIRKIVALVAFAIPILFEIVKGICILGWEWITKGH